MNVCVMLCRLLLRSHGTATAGQLIRASAQARQAAQEQACALALHCDGQATAEAHLAVRLWPRRRRPQLFPKQADLKLWGSLRG